jgi:hypothetical protein
MSVEDYYFVLHVRRHRTVRKNLEEEKNFGELTFPDLKNYDKSLIIKTVTLAYRQTYRTMKYN